MSESGRPDVSMMVVAHAEGRTLSACVAGCERAASAASDAGLVTERLLVLSAADRATRAWAAAMIGSAWRVLSCDADDLASARNLGIAHSVGARIAVIDGGDLPCAEWLVRAHAADAQDGPAVWHPELAIRFGPIAEARVQVHPDTAALGLDCAGLVDANPFAGGVFARRSVFEAVPYPIPDPARGWAQSDWHWHCEVVAAGIHHRVVGATWHYVRLHSAGEGLSTREAAERRRPGPSAMLTRTSAMPKEIERGLVDLAPKL